MKYFMAFTILVNAGYRTVKGRMEWIWN